MHVVIQQFSIIAPAWELDNHDIDKWPTVCKFRNICNEACRILVYDSFSTIWWSTIFCSIALKRTNRKTLKDYDTASLSRPVYDAWEYKIYSLIQGNWIIFGDLHGLFGLDPRHLAFSGDKTNWQFQGKQPIYLRQYTFISDFLASRWFMFYVADIYNGLCGLPQTW